MPVPVALRYEGINLEVLSLLFQQTGKDELVELVDNEIRLYPDPGSEPGLCIVVVRTHTRE